jgi:organic hydroperoxide reductase OsmC/OhrA
MSTHSAEVIWSRDDQKFIDNRYSRKHLLRFDGGTELFGSSSPLVVPMPYSAPDAVDPEEAFVASLSSCHMLWFLSIAARRGHVVDRYHDTATGVMGKDAHGKTMMTIVTLRPQVHFSGPEIPTAAAIGAIHHEAHEECFIANSVKTAVVCEPRPPG